MTTKKIRAVGLGIFIVGLVVGLFFSIVITWSDLEASSFDSMWRPDEIIRLNCPVMITSDETGVIDMVFENTLDRPITLSVWTMVSAASATALDETHHLIDLQAGASAPLQLMVTKDNAAYGRFIFVRVNQFRNYPLPERNGVCGIWVMPLSFLSGNTWLALFFVMAVGGLAGGAFMILNSYPINQRGRRAVMPFLLGAVVLAAMGLAAWGTWFPALFLIIVVVLMALEMFREITSI